MTTGGWHAWAEGAGMCHMDLVDLPALKAGMPPIGFLT
jgi:hypothetical protein